jgi:peptide/nickel transport system substrate-binding protein
MVVATALLLQGTAYAEEPVAGGTLNVVVTGAPATLVNLLDSNRQTANIAGKVVEGLLRYDSNFEPQPLLATAWTVSDDGLTYTFKLREGVKWHDGEDFSSEDVKFSLETLKKFGPRARITFAAIKTVEAPDAHTVVVKLDRPAPYLLKSLTSTESPIVPRHAYPNPDDPRSSKNNNAPIGTGPFVLVEWVQGSHVTLRKNDHYWRKGHPLLDQIIVRFVGDAAATSAALETGEAQVSFNVSLPDVKRLAENPKLEVLAQRDVYLNNTSVLEFNLNNPNLAKIEVRHAIAHAIDKTFVREWVYYGYSEPVTSIIPAALKSYSDDSAFLYDFDIEKANKLLDQAGLPLGADGTRFALRLSFIPGAAFKQSSEYIRSALSKVGIKVEIVEGDLASFMKRVYTERQFDLNLNGLSLLFDPTAGVQRIYWSDGIANPLPYVNAAHYNNPEVDTLFRAAAVEQDEAKRAGQFKQIQSIVGKDLPAYPIAGLTTVTVLNASLKDIFNSVDLQAGDFSDAWLKP